jgi:hypothetical protein
METHSLTSVAFYCVSPVASLGRVIGSNLDMYSVRSNHNTAALTAEQHETNLEVTMTRKQIEEMNPFSKQADELLEKSIALDRAAKPGDTYVDPVWGVVQVSSEPKNLDAAREAIERKDRVCFDVCAEHGQIFNNVKHTDWFVEAVAEAL